MNDDERIGCLPIAARIASHALKPVSHIGVRPFLWGGNRYRVAYQSNTHRRELIMQTLRQTVLQYPGGSVGQGSDTTRHHIRTEMTIADQALFEICVGDFYLI